MVLIYYSFCRVSWNGHNARDTPCVRSLRPLFPICQWGVPVSCPLYSPNHHVKTSFVHDFGLTKFTLVSVPPFPITSPQNSEARIVMAEEERATGATGANLQWLLSD